MKKGFYLFMTIFMIIVTTAMLFAGFAVLPVSRINFMLINALSLMGYLGAFCYFDSFIKVKTPTKK